MKKILPVIIIMCLSASCFINKAEDKETTIGLQPGREGIPVSIHIEKGEEWTNVMKLVGPLKANILPQIVIWAEKPDGSLLQTIYVTGAQKKTKGHATKSKKGTLFWKECFPLWSAKMAAEGMKLPQEDGADFDSVTSATPQSTFYLDTKIKPVNTPFYIYVEINKSADYNSAFTEENSDWVGQPALVYSCMVTSTRKGKEDVFKLAGYDDAGLKDGKNTDITKLDTALEIVKEIKIVF